MRPQVPVHRSKNLPSPRRSTGQQRRPSPARRKNDEESRLPLNQVNRWTGQVPDRPQSLDGIVASNTGVLQEIRDYEQFLGGISQIESLSVTSSVDLARAQANPAAPFRGSRTPQRQQKNYHENFYSESSSWPPQRTNPHDFSASTETESSHEQQTPASIDENHHPISRTLQYWEDELRKNTRENRKSVNHDHAIRLPQKSLADNVASPNSVSENSRPVAAFSEHNTRAVTHSETKRALPPYSRKQESSLPLVHTAPFRCHSASPSLQRVPSNGISQYPRGERQAVEPTTTSLLNFSSLTNLWTSCSPNFLEDSSKVDRTHLYSSSFQQNQVYTEETSQDDSDSDIIPAYSNRKRRAQHKTKVQQNRFDQRMYEDVMPAHDSHPQTLSARGDDRTPVHHGRRLSTADTIRTPTNHEQDSERRWLFTPENRRNATAMEGLVGSSEVRRSAPTPRAPDTRQSGNLDFDQNHLPPPASDSIDDFDPFNIGNKPKMTPRVSNYKNAQTHESDPHTSSSKSSLQPSKRDTKTTRKRSHTIAGNENNLATAVAQGATKKETFETTDQPAEGHSRNLVSGLRNEGDNDQEKRNIRAQQNTLRNYEMLRKMDNRNSYKEVEDTEQRMLPGTSKSSVLPPASKPIATSIPRKALRSEVSQLQRVKHAKSRANIYVAYLRFGQNPLDLLQLCERPANQDSKLRKGEVPLRVLASSISTTDCDIRRGEWTSIRLEPYIIPGTSVVGVVTGKDNQRRCGFKEGDVVLGLIRTGGNSRFTSASKDALIQIPPGLDPCIAVCLTETYLTAFQALHLGQRSRRRYGTDSLRGKSILVLSGSSNLGHALIEVAVAGGADSCYALGKTYQHDGIRHRGGIPLPLDPDQWLTLIGRQIHILVVVSDSNGLHTDNATPDHFKAVCEDGEVVFIGPPGVDLAPTTSSSSHPNRLICKSLKGSLTERSHFYNLFDSWGSDQKLGRSDLNHLVTLLEDRLIQPVVLERVPLSKVARVHAIIETRKTPGFIVCAPWIHEPSQQLLSNATISSSISDSDATFTM